MAEKHVSTAAKSAISVNTTTTFVPPLCTSMTTVIGTTKNNVEGKGKKIIGVGLVSEMNE